MLIGGCHPGDCHYQEGNYKALRRFRLLRRVIESLGIEKERLRLEWISASEADRLRKVADEMAADIRALGPLQLSIPAEDFLSEEAADAELPSLGIADDTPAKEVAVP